MCHYKMLKNIFTMPEQLKYVTSCKEVVGVKAFRDSRAYVHDGRGGGVKMHKLA